MLDNYNLVDKAFDILHPIMAGFIGQKMSALYKGKWWDEVLSTLSEQFDLITTGSYSELVDSLDRANCLRLIDRKAFDLFDKKTALSVRNWAKELMNVRNELAHKGSQDMIQHDAERALDTMALLCEELDQSTSDEIWDMYYDLRSEAEIAVHEPSSNDTGIYPTQQVVIPRDGQDNLLALIGTDMVQETALRRKVTYNGQTMAYPVYRVRLDVLFYNDQNDRIATWVSRYRAENNVDSLYDMDMDTYNDVIENFIIDSNPDSIKKTQNSIMLVGQQQPGVALADGRIVDGNRRFTCLRRLQRENSEPLYFETVIMDIDIQEDRKQIKLLELAIQHGEEKKVEYDLIDYSIGTFRDIEQTGLLTVEEYADSTGEKKAEVRKRLEVARIICEFLEYIQLPEQYHIARDYQVFSLFQEMLSPLHRLDGDEQTVLKQIAFNNTLLRAIPDQRHFIRDIKNLVKDNAYTTYFTEQAEINRVLYEALQASEIHEKADLERFAEMHTAEKKQMQDTMERALLRYRNDQLKSRPQENVQKCADLLMDIDSRQFARMDEGEKAALRKQIESVAAIAERFLNMLQ